jgi:hypothetical protein
MMAKSKPVKINLLDSEKDRAVQESYRSVRVDDK